MQQVDGYIAGIDYPAYETVPKGLSFSCKGRLPGYYADIETRCQVKKKTEISISYGCVLLLIDFISIYFFDRFGIGVYFRAQYIRSYVQTERCSTKRIECAIGGQMSIVHLQRNCIEIMKNCIVNQAVMPYDIRIETQAEMW